MANRYWVGGTGTWDDSTTTNWSTSSGGGGGASVPGSSDVVIFDGASGGGTVTILNNKSIAALTFGAFTGTLDTGGYDISIAGNCSITGTGTRTLTLNDSLITCEYWNASTTTNLTFNRGTSTITTTGSADFNGGNLTYYSVVIQPAASGSLQINSTPVFENLTITLSSTNTSITFGTNITINNNLAVNGTSAAFKVLMTSNTLGTARTLTVGGTVSGQYADFQDITGAGAASWNIASMTGGSGDCGGNSGITFTTPSTQHFTNVNGGNWSTAANWTSRVPLPQDTAVMDCAFGTSKTVTADAPRLCKDLDWTGATWTTSLTFTYSANRYVFGGVTLINGLTLTSSNDLILYGRSSHTITGNGCEINSPVTISGLNSTYTLGGDFLMNSVRPLRLAGNSATLNANNYVISVGGIESSGTSTLTLGSATHLITGTLGGGPWTSPSTLNANTSTIKFTDTSNTAITFAGGGKTFNNVWFSRAASTGAITISGSNTFEDFRDDGTAAHTIKFTAGTTSTFNDDSWFVRGNPGNLISIDSTTTGTYNFVKTGVGIVQTDYLDIQHCVATPGNTWFAGSNSQNDQATSTAGSGWVFANHATFRQPIRPKMFTPGLAR